MSKKTGAVKPEAGTSDLARISDAGGSVRCVFSALDELRVGTGTTTRKHLSRIYWYVEELDEERFSLRRINSHHVPSGDEVVVTLKELVANYTPEVEFFEGNTIPALELLQEYLDEGTEQRAKGKLYSAQDSFGRALGLDEGNVRALFNLGLIALALNDLDKARDTMRELLKIRSTFTGKDQHLFNEFGIALRKNGLFEEASAYYAKALEFVEDDEHLYYNLARTNYERGHWAECIDAIGRSRSLNPGLAATSQLGELIVELANNDSLREQYNKPPIPDDLAVGLAGLMRAERPTLPASDGSGAETLESGRARAGTGPTDIEPASDSGNQAGTGVSREDLKFDI
ncbi:MAG: tetratricopeptide repeat protein [Pseudodesulfovibrio sp.]|uniref:Tetratricopeptide repeat protein n=1 Tax=Pseudodesulfovibrio aespoeensis (strain ATCC 700646 / DSM 10631 / Aspo-2) TaxID=643562 RepID=E6VY12_PSEA9|nr:MULTISPECIES: tetratricopeptide repeat protein [Pseudodesulfovibrio]MBU4191207.1 tetratricopeptide repeat protein [Pseudomonadota bacterium]ADU63826.1 Tetratricopeptide repeat protein [Pseudodesulfovibrio aespoeensis Aspo-2]MBU4244302.1 tetratricopeptide repeat protein [Pseudomonadota bacterium]MBU4475580.1 tetratricopeptide repeat protein [Pseudomonadota bacterium]MBU4515018.1 tetratricopeptide repeat protein [Pseudomonadota bacterium]